MLELRSNPTMKPAQSRRSSTDQQPRRLVLALVILLAALVALVIKDRQFWFGGDESILDADSTSETARPVSQPAVRPSATAIAKTHAAIAAKSASTLKKPATASATFNQPAAASTSVSGTRTVLAPLEVEVVAGDTHRTVRPGSNSTKVEIVKAGAAASASSMPVPTSAAEHERMPAGMGSYEANYPLLAQHMNVEGSVVLQALIGADGIIQNLHVLSGPAILATAAQQAVREWKFKPVVQNGQAVETKAMITVNFSIRVADNASKEQLASATPLRYTYAATR